MKFFTELTLTTSILMALCAAAAADDYYTYEHGKLERPQGYRDWPYVGTPLTPNDMNAGKAPFRSSTRSTSIPPAGRTGRKPARFAKERFSSRSSSVWV